MLYFAAVYGGDVFEKCVELRGLEPLAFWMQTSRIEVVDGRWCRSEVFAGRPGSLLVGAVAALCCCTSRHHLTLTCQTRTW